jgi:hypothetical protein
MTSDKWEMIHLNFYHHISVKLECGVDFFLKNEK